MKKPILTVEITPLEREETLKYSDTDMVKLRLSVPQISGKNAAARRINAHYRSLLNQTYRYATHTLFKSAVRLFQQFPDGHFLPFECYLTYQVTRNAEGILSLYYEVYQFTGGAHGTTVRHSDTWSLSKGFPLDAEEILGPRARREILYQARNEAARQLAAGEGMYFDNYAKLMRKYYQPTDFFLTERGFSQYWQQYTIAPYVMGIPTFTLPEPAKLDETDELPATVSPHTHCKT